MDLILRVSPSFLDSLPGEQGGMEPIGYDEMQEVIRASGEVPVTCPGGSASNMLRGLAKCGHACAIVGKRGQDPMGHQYVATMEQMGVGSYLTETQTPTTIVLSMVDPKGARTMRTFMGASQELRAEELDPKQFEGIKFLHIEGYSFYNIEPTLRAIRLAKAAGAQVSLDLASFEVVRQFYDPIRQTLEQSVDLVFANELEAEAITGEPPEKACDFLAEWCPTAVVMMGKAGGFVRQEERKIRYDTSVIEEPIDTTGAGDVFACGFISGLLDGRPLEACAKKGAMLGAAVVQVIGAVIPESLWPPLLAQIS